MIPLSVPYIGKSEKKYVLDCLDTGWISSSGAYVNKFENAFKNYVGSKYAVACINGTSGLHISLLISGVKENDLVIAPNLTFVATINSIKYANADPILVDVNFDTWQMDLDLLENWLENNTIIVKDRDLSYCIEKKSKKIIKAIVPVHVLGYMNNMIRIKKISKKYFLKIVEDSTESLGSFYKKKHSGNFGDFGVFSFNGNKIISTGGGGMIVTNNKKYAEKAKHLTTTAKISTHEYIHDEVGFNYRLVNILAALGLGQMENLSTILEKKKQIANLYFRELGKLKGIEFQKQISDSNPNYWLFTLSCINSKSLIHFLKDKNIDCRAFWKPMNTLKMFKKNIYVSKKNYSWKLYNSCVSIPCSVGLKQESQLEIIANIKKFYK